MQLSDIREEVLSIVQDDSYDDEDKLNAYINKVRGQLAAEINFPALKVVGPITATASSTTASLASLTSGFSGRLSRVYSSNGKVRVFPTVEEMYDWYIAAGKLADMSQEGTIESVAQEGNILFLHKVPSVDTTLTCIAFADAPVLSEDSDECDLFPDTYHWEAYVHGTAYLIYDQIEDGMEGEKVNTLLHYARSLDPNNPASAISKIREWLARNRPHSLTGVWNV